MPLPHEWPGIVCARAVPGRPLRSTCIDHDGARCGRRHDDIGRLTVSRPELTSQPICPLVLASGSDQRRAPGPCVRERNTTIIKYLIAVAALLSNSPAFAQHPMHQQQNDHLGASVMPFDLTRSTHVFTPTADGGTQEVISKDSDPQQIALIRDHLRKEAAAFAHGDYTDPTSIHGTDMPGLKELKAGAARIRIAFEELPQGARLQFSTSDAALTVALHQWFEAQVREHGGDAIMHPQ